MTTTNRFSDPPSPSRREFTALSIAAGVAAATGASAAVTVVEQPVDVRTPSGVSDSFIVHPEGKGSWPAVILFVDAFGQRPTMRGMAKRLAAEGYAVLVPNPYYRATKAPGISSNFDFSNPADRAKLTELRAPLTNDAVGQDAAAYLEFLDAQPFVNKKARAGAFGYCMGGLMTMQASAAAPNRIGAGASFHGGGLVTDKPDSPHLFVPKLNGEFLIAVAADDDQAQPEAKIKLTEAFRAARIPAQVEVYEGTLHGWCVKDMPLRNGKPIYNEPQAERAWAELTALFKRRLV